MVVRGGVEYRSEWWNYLGSAIRSWHLLPPRALAPAGGCGMMRLATVWAFQS